MVVVGGVRLHCMHCQLCGSRRARRAPTCKLAQGLSEVVLLTFEQVILSPDHDKPLLQALRWRFVAAWHGVERRRKRKGGRALKACVAKCTTL